MKRFLVIAAGVAALTMYVMPEARAADSLPRDVGPDSSPAYQKACGGCHFAYQPGWLPERSWRAIMGSLGQHHGKSVALDGAERDGILAHLVANSADAQKSLRSVQVIASIKAGDTPTAVTQVPYVSGIHAGFLDPAFKPQPKVDSLVNCTTCHSRAAAGAYSAVQYTVSDESFRTNEPAYADVLSPSERLALRKR